MRRPCLAIRAWLLRLLPTSHSTHLPEPCTAAAIRRTVWGSVLVDCHLSVSSVFGMSHAAQYNCKTHTTLVQCEAPGRIYYCCRRRCPSSLLVQPSWRSMEWAPWPRTLTVLVTKPVSGYQPNRRDRGKRLSSTFSWETGTIFEPFRHKEKNRKKNQRQIQTKIIEIKPTVEWL